VLRLRTQCPERLELLNMRVLHEAPERRQMLEEPLPQRNGKGVGPSLRYQQTVQHIPKCASPCEHFPPVLVASGEWRDKSKWLKNALPQFECNSFTERIRSMIPSRVAPI
jgi:hypothetical protein